MEQAKGAGRRRHRPEFKRQILTECARPGASVARVALAHGLNANLVHKWRRLADGSRQLVAAPAQAFVPVALEPAASEVAADIRIELRRGATAINVSWPLAGAAQCAAWVREILVK